MNVKQVIGFALLMAFSGAGTAAAEGGFAGGAELLLLRMYAHQGAGNDGAPGSLANYFPETGHNAAGRYWFGYQLESGLGLRTRIFHWEDQSNLLGFEREQDIELYDIEATIASRIHEWDLTGFGGVRWGSVELQGIGWGGIRPSDFDGAGMTLGGEVRRRIAGNFSLLGGVRYSTLYGETTFEPLPVPTLDNTTLDILELKLGLQWCRATQSGGQWLASAAWEHQLYGTDTMYSYVIDPETPGDITLAGPTIAIGYRW